MSNLNNNEQSASQMSLDQNDGVVPELQNAIQEQSQSFTDIQFLSQTRNKNNKELLSIIDQFHDSILSLANKQVLKFDKGYMSRYSSQQMIVQKQKELAEEEALKKIRQENQEFPANEKYGNQLNYYYQKQSLPNQEEDVTTKVANNNISGFANESEHQRAQQIINNLKSLTNKDSYLQKRHFSSIASNHLDNARQTQIQSSFKMRSSISQHHAINLNSTISEFVQGNQQNDDDDEEEGFHSDNSKGEQSIPQQDDAVEEGKQNKFKKQVSRIYHGNHSKNIQFHEQIFHLKKQLLEQERLVAHLKSEIQDKVNQLCDNAVSYLKDLVHYKELVFHSSTFKKVKKSKTLQKSKTKKGDPNQQNPTDSPEEHGEIDEEDDEDSKKLDQLCIEVKFFDETSCLDENCKQILNFKLRDIQIQYERRLNEFKKSYGDLKAKFIKIAKQMASIAQRYDPVQLFKSIVLLEPNVYKIWRILQDNLGHEKIFTVFNDQKGEYGINYPEIDKHLAKCQAGHRDFQRLQKQLEDQFQVLANNASNQMDDMRNELEEKEQQIQKQEARFQEELKQMHDKVDEALSIKYLNHVKEMKKLHDEEIKSMFKQKGDDENCSIYQEVKLLKMKCIFIKWNMVSRTLRIVNKLKAKEQLINNGQENANQTKKEQINSLKQEQHETQQSAKDQQKQERSEIPNQDSNPKEEDVQDLCQELRVAQEQIVQLQSESEFLKANNNQYQSNITRLLNDCEQLRVYSENLRKQKRDVEGKLGVIEKTQKIITDKLGLHPNNQHQISQIEIQQSISSIDKNKVQAIQLALETQQKNLTILSQINNQQQKTSTDLSKSIVNNNNASGLISNGSNQLKVANAPSTKDEGVVTKICGVNLQLSEIEMNLMASNIDDDKLGIIQEPSKIQIHRITGNEFGTSQIINDPNINNKQLHQSISLNSNQGSSNDNTNNYKSQRPLMKSQQTQTDEGGDRILRSISSIDKKGTLLSKQSDNNSQLYRKENSNSLVRDGYPEMPSPLRKKPPGSLLHPVSTILSMPQNKLEKQLQNQNLVLQKLQEESMLKENIIIEQQQVLENLESENLGEIADILTMYQKTDAQTNSSVSQRLLPDVSQGQKNQQRFLTEESEETYASVKQQNSRLQLIEEMKSNIMSKMHRPNRIQQQKQFDAHVQKKLKEGINPQATFEQMASRFQNQQINKNYQQQQLPAINQRKEYAQNSPFNQKGYNEDMQIQLKNGLLNQSVILSKNIRKISEEYPVQQQQQPQIQQYQKYQ